MAAVAEAAAPASPAPAAVRPVPAPPSVHVRAVITWLAIFPLVAIGMLLIAPISESWHPVLRAFVLTLVVVPLAVYVVVPGEISTDPVRMGDTKLLILGLGTTLEPYTSIRLRRYGFWS